MTNSTSQVPIPCDTGGSPPSTARRSAAGSGLHRLLPTPRLDHVNVIDVLTHQSQFSQDETPGLDIAPYITGLESKIASRHLPARFDEIPHPHRKPHLAGKGPPYCLLGNIALISTQNTPTYIDSPPTPETSFLAGFGTHCHATLDSRIH